MATSLHESKASEAEPFLSLDLSLGGLFSPRKTLDRKCSVSFSSQKPNHQSRTTPNNRGKEQAPLPSRQSINKAQHSTTSMWDFGGSGSEAPPSSITLQRSPHLHFVDWMMKDAAPYSESLVKAPPSSVTFERSPHHFVDWMKKDTQDSLKRTESLVEEMKQKRKARTDYTAQDSECTSLCNSSLVIQDAYSHLRKENSLPTGYEHPSLQSSGIMRGLDSDSTQNSSRRLHQSQSDMMKAMMLEAPARSEYIYDGAAHSCNQETPSHPLSGHSPTVSCASCSPTQTALCLSSSPSVLPSSSSSRVICRAPMRSNGVNRMLPSKRKPSDGEEEDVNYILPSKRKPSVGDEEGKSCRISSSELLENGDNLEYEQSSTRTRVAEFEAPRSRCGSNSDIIGSMDPSLAMPSTGGSMMYTHPFTMVPMPGPFSMPIQWGLSLPHSMHYPSFASHQLPENTPLPWSHFVPASPGALQPGVIDAAAPYNESKLQNSQEISARVNAPTCDIALGTSPLVKEARLSNAAQESRSLVMAHAAVPGPVIEMCTSASRSLSSSPTAHYASISHTQEVRPSAKLRASTFESGVPGMSRPLPSSLEANCSSMVGDSALSSKSSLRQQDDQFKARKSSVSQVNCIQGCSTSLCTQKTEVVGLVGSLHSLLPRRKPVKTVRFSSVDEDFVKSNSDRDGSSSMLSERSRLFKREMDDSCQGQSVTMRERDHEEGNENTGISSVSSDQGVAAPDVVRGGKLEGKNSADLPRVSTTGAGPNGKTIYGVMYITKSKQACLICSCHGTHMSPSEFVQHSGSTDLSYPERNILVGGFPFVS